LKKSYRLLHNFEVKTEGEMTLILYFLMLTFFHRLVLLIFRVLTFPKVLFAGFKVIRPKLE